MQKGFIMFFQRFFKFLKYFGNGYEFKLINMLFMAFMTSLLEFLSIVLVFPFLLIMVNPRRVINNPFSNFLEETFNIHGANNMILIIGGLIAAVIIIKNLYSIFILYWQSKIISEWALDIKEKLMKFYLYSPYEADLQRNKSDIIERITTNVDNVMQFFVFKVINFISNSLVIAVIFAILIKLLPLFTIIAIIFFSITGLLQNEFFRNWGQKLSDKKFKLLDGTYNSVINSLKNIKDIKINGCQKFFFDFYKNISEKSIPYSEKINLIPQMPQFIIEIIFIFTMIILCYGILSKYGEDPSNILITFGIVAISIYRVVPQIYKNQVYLNYINLYSKNTDELFEIYDEYNKYEYPVMQDTKERIAFNEVIKIQNLSYSYNKVINVLDDISFNIRKGEFIGIVGLSGAGKTTLVDCLLGLLEYNGEVFVDDILLNSENIKTFRNIIGYVPQSISTIQGDIYTNVAWGIDKKYIDKERVEEALKTAQLYDQLIQTENGLEIELKQDGTGLSFGQKQRIGIARALYRNPEIIVFDEATSNLDVKIENKLTEIINQIKGSKTIIAIAHRLSTLVSCDRIVYLKDGKIIDVGTFRELSEKHADFEEIVKLSRIKFDDNEKSI